MVKIDKKGTYELDVIRGTEIPALTKKNSLFVEAVIRLDSNYKKENGIVEPHRNFSLDNCDNNRKTYFSGSSGYWFKQMQDPQSKYSYSECVLGAVIAIDRSNSTHLETIDGGRKELATRIVNKCPDVNELKKALLDRFEVSNKNHLINHLTDKGLELVKKNCCDSFPISFVSKFCSYASMALLNQDLYSKYDNVVSNVLPLYISKYYPNDNHNMIFKVKRFGDNYDLKKKHGLKMYQNYNDVIGRFVKDVGLSRSEFDHILWYCTKG